MYKVQIFNLIVNKTASECNVTPEEIRSTSHREDGNFDLQKVYREAERC